MMTSLLGGHVLLLVAVVVKYTLSSQALSTGHVRVKCPLTEDINQTHKVFLIHHYDDNDSKGDPMLDCEWSEAKYDCHNADMSLVAVYKDFVEAKTEMTRDGFYRLELYPADEQEPRTRCLTDGTDNAPADISPLAHSTTANPPQSRDQTSNAPTETASAAGGANLGSTVLPILLCVLPRLRVP